MAQDWKELTRMTQGRPFVVERVRLGDSGPFWVGVAIEGRFEPPVLARLEEEDQLFVAAFVKSHGSIKAMERLFGVSYPTIKNRLNRIGSLFDLVDVEAEPSEGGERDPEDRSGEGIGSPDRASVLDRIASGELSVDEALALLEGR